MSESICKYCPSIPSSYYCEACDISFCLNCVPEDARYFRPRCTLCRNHLQTLNSEHVVAPFWTRWGYFFKIALSPTIFLALLSFAFLGSVISTNGLIASTISFFYWSTLLMMLFELSNVISDGRSDIPTVAELWKKAEPLLLLKLLTQVLITILMIGIVNNILGQWAAVSLIILYGIGFPASVLILTLEKRFLSAANPMRILYVITSIGAPYFLLYGFWLLSVLLSYQMYMKQIDGPILYNIFALQVSYYFWTVWFALLGYVAYQYHHKLGLALSHRPQYQHQSTEHTKSHSASKVRTYKKSSPEKSPVVKEAEILVSEERHADALNLLQMALKQSSVNMDVHRYYLKLMVDQKEYKRLSTSAKHLARQFLHQDNVLEGAHITVITKEAISDWRPDLIEDRFKIALSLIKMGRRDFALDFYQSIMTSSEDSEFIANSCFEAAKLLAEDHNCDQKAIECLRRILIDYPMHSIVADAKTYLAILKQNTTSNDSSDDALFIEDN